MDDALAELEWVRALFTEVVIPDNDIGPLKIWSRWIHCGREADGSHRRGHPGDGRPSSLRFHRRSGSAGLCRRAQIDVSVLAESARVLRADVIA